MGTGLLNHHVKKGNMMVVMMDLDQNLFSLNSKLWYFFLFPLTLLWYSIIIGVVVMVNDYHHRRHLMGGEGRPFIEELHDSHVGRAFNDCNGSTICKYIYIYHEQKTSV